MHYRFITASVLSLMAIAAVSCGGGSETDTDVDMPENTSIERTGATASLADIIDPGTMMERIDIPYDFETAGSPCWHDGFLYFTNNNLQEPDHSRTMRISDSGEFKVIRDPNGATTSTYTTGRGTFYCTEMVGRRVVEMSPNGDVVGVLAEMYDGKPLDNPNDMTLDARGGAYFTDSSFLAGHELYQTACVYYVNADGDIKRVIDDISFPNGLELTPGGQTLIVVNTMGGNDKGESIYAFDVNTDGTVANKRVFGELEMTPEEMAKEDGASGADGTAMDIEGNLYVATTKGLGIQVFNRDGEHLGNIPCPSVSNNITFGGPEMKTMFVSAVDGIYRLPVKIAGLTQPQ